MKRAGLLSVACAVGVLAVSQQSVAGPEAEFTKEPVGFASVGMLEKGAMIEKAASARSVAARATATSGITVYGGFSLASSAVVYILVRGNSLGTLGVTQGYLDAPRVRIYDSAGRDLIYDGNNNPGFNGCLSSNTTTDWPVIYYYQYVRFQPVQPRDGCIAVSASAGTYTFSVTPSIPGVTTVSTSSSPNSGEILFEVTLGP